MKENTASRSSPWLTAGVVAAIIALWWIVAALNVFPPSTFPSPVAVIRGFGEELRSGRLAGDLIASLFRVGAGFTLAAICGVPLGLWMGVQPRVRAALLPLINFFRSLSPLAWIPFAILWFGIGDAPAVFLIFMTTFFPIVLSTTVAVAGIPSIYFMVGRDHGFSQRELIRQVVLPAIAPQIITALRMTAGLAWLVVVAAEMIAGRDGLGFAIWDARNGLRMDLLVSGMVVIGVIGVVLDRVLTHLTKIPSVRWAYER
ncbi:MAG TPA: ABC transporter permease [Tahibacter sp.]|nr:ABC transporter permease [Tahibacter sp.]